MEQKGLVSNPWLYTSRKHIKNEEFSPFSLHSLFDRRLIRTSVSLQLPLCCPVAAASFAVYHFSDRVLLIPSVSATYPVCRFRRLQLQLPPAVPRGSTLRRILPPVDLLCAWCSCSLFVAISVVALLSAVLSDQHFGTTFWISLTADRLCTLIKMNGSASATDPLRLLSAAYRLCTLLIS